MNRLVFKVLLVLAALAPALVEGESATNVVLARHAEDLVVLKGQTLVPFNPQHFLQTPYTVLYFGAGWCPDCRRFSPSLVAAYNREAREAKRFEVLLLSHDKSAEGLLKFMQVEKMNWPALAFDKLVNAKDLTRYFSGHGIPCLTVIDRHGTIVLQSKNDQDANEVLQELENLIKNKGTDEPGSAHKA